MSNASNNTKPSKPYPTEAGANKQPGKQDGGRGNDREPASEEIGGDEEE